MRAAKMDARQFIGGRRSQSIGCRAIEPDAVFLNKNEVEEYLKEKPFPETEHYTAENLLWDTHSSGSWWLPDELTKEQEEYITEMVEHFL